MKIDENIYVSRLKNGDPTALEKFMDLYGTKLFRTIYLMVKDEKLAEDILQEVFITLFYKIHQFRKESSLYTWIYKITIHKCNKYMKTSWFQRVFPTDIIWDHFKNSQDFQDEYVDKEHIQNLIFSLPDHYRCILILFYYEDFTMEEIHQITGENINTIKSKLHRGRKLLKDLLEKEMNL
ncbi:RNA polymerase sigma factor [Inediibacterium massiliense]|uniref:RNA polymerase sigma factor n=1 Tax=Inediibacterium massiliense TaxID=1658111 RepID=UPI0006B58171|nr:sigma-70 family RNA polymerase sigma factor [Inediibacterium massiliense]